MMINIAKKEYAISAYSFLAHDELLYFMQQLAAHPNGKIRCSKKPFFIAFSGDGRRYDACHKIQEARKRVMHRSLAPNVTD